MPITPKNLVRHELIGLQAEIASSSNKADVLQKGMVLDETRNTLTIETAKGRKSFPKKNRSFVFSLPSGARVKVDGNLLVARPEDRIKKRLKAW